MALSRAPDSEGAINSDHSGNCGPLGESVQYLKSYNYGVLHRIKRSERAGQKFKSGFDRWVSYEFTFLKTTGCPACCVLEIMIPAKSEFIVESKSLKLYLGGFSQEVFRDESEVVKTINSDLSKLLESNEIRVRNLALDSEILRPQAAPDALLIDNQETSCDRFDNPEPGLLLTSEQMCAESLYSNLFRSLCPVTGQPDYATVVISYEGFKIDPKSLLRYLVSFRNHSGFHETCCEQIFAEISQKCAPSQLSVACFFNRRGGIDINPVRSSLGAIGDQYLLRCMRQ